MPSPIDDTPDVSVLVPTMNEEVTVADFIDMCIEGFQRAGVRGEIVLVDSSSDRTALIARERGAVVVDCTEKGIGRAYQMGIRHIRGRYVLMGDADCTYDFREIRPFLAALDAGYEFVMGTRVKGSVEKGSRPLLHRFFGAPLTNFVFNRVIGARFSDIHCGMRAMTRDALININLTATGWEYASQMIIKSLRGGLRCVEVPITFLKEPEGRIGKLQANRLEPWRAGWRTLHTVFSNRPAFFLIKPGLLTSFLFLLANIVMVSGLRRIGDLELSVNSQFVVSVLALAGSAAFAMGIIADSLDLPNRRLADWAAIVSFRRTFSTLLACSAISLFTGLLFVSRFVGASLDYSPSMDGLARTFLLSLTVTGMSFFLFCSALVLEYLNQWYGAEKDRDG